LIRRFVGVIQDFSNSVFSFFANAGEFFENSCHMQM